MHFHLEKLAVVAAFAIGGMGTAYAQNAVEQLQPLVETTAHRLMIGEQVALAKWDSGKVVEDTPREAQVILGAIKDGTLNDEYRMSLDEFLTRLEYLAQAIDAVDEAARNDYQLASYS